MNTVQLIVDLDKTISMIRESWLDAKPESKDKYMDRINSLLDERYRLMQLRDKDTRLSAAADDYAPTGLATAATIKIDGGAAERKITGVIKSDKDEK